MTGRRVPEPPRRPEDLSDLFLQRANAGDVEAVVALYEPDAVLAFPQGRLAVGHEQIRAVYAEFRQRPQPDNRRGPALTQTALDDQPPARDADPGMAKI
jgi:ketosteroid isomerase-like protein